MPFFHSHSGRDSGIDRKAEAGNLPRIGLPHGVSVLSEELERAVKPGWFGRSLRDVYDTYIKQILPLSGDELPKNSRGHRDYSDLSSYLALVTITFKDSLGVARQQPPDFSAKFRKLFSWHEEQHHIATLASVSIDFSHRLRRHGKIGDANEIMLDAHALAQRFRDPLLQAQSHYEVGRIAGTLGKYSVASGHFRNMLCSASAHLEHNPECMHWAFPRIPNVIDHVLNHTFSQHDTDAKALLSHSYLLLKCLLDNRHFIAACCHPSDVVPAHLAAGRAAAMLGSQDDCRTFCTRACVAAGVDDDLVLSCQAAIGAAKVLHGAQDSAGGIRVLETTIKALEPILMPKSGKPNLEVVRKFGDLLDSAADLFLAVGEPSRAVAMMEKRDKIFLRFKLALPDDGGLGDPELV